MSIQVPVCLICKAALGDEPAFKRLVATMRINFKHHAWTQIPCKCNPRCHTGVTEEQLTILDERLKHEINNECGNVRNP